MVDFILFVFVVLIFAVGVWSGMWVALTHGTLSAFIASIADKFASKKADK